MKLISKIRHTVGEFSLVERILFYVLSFFLIWSAFMLLYSFMDSFRSDAPARGGELHEGVVGYPSFVNPLLSTTNSGRDLSYLIYSGLMRINEKGVLVPDLAESFSVSEDGTQYTFVLREGLRFHDGEPLTSADVIFTIEMAKEPKVKSTVAANWQGVSVAAPDPRTVVFTLKTPYAPFIENTSLGIIPKHIWDTADLDQFTFSPYNFNPVGSGPYLVREISRNQNGSPYLYELQAWSNYKPGEKNISSLFIHIYPDSESRLAALREGKIDSAGDLSPAEAKVLKDAGFDVREANLLRVFGVFFNQNQATVFTDRKVRAALEAAVDRTRIIDTVLLSYANVEDGPLPRGSGSIPTSNTEQTPGAKATSTKTLSFTLATSDNPELAATAALLQEQWAAIGADVKIVTLPPSELAETVIQPRKYDALLFGEVTGRGKDIYPFWYSGERKHPGLNIALYTNTKADILLQKARSATSTAVTDESLSAFTDIFHEDIPAIFLYSPRYLYVVPKKVQGLELPALEMSQERFTGILASHIKTKRVWK